MSDPSAAGVDEWDGGIESPLDEVANMTLKDLCGTDVPAIGAAVKAVLADLDNPARYGDRESS
jgi:hypothetical protein